MEILSLPFAFVILCDLPGFFLPYFPVSRIPQSLLQNWHWIETKHSKLALPTLKFRYSLRFTFSTRWTTSYRHLYNNLFTYLFWIQQDRYKNFREVNCIMRMRSPRWSKQNYLTVHESSLKKTLYPLRLCVVEESNMTISNIITTQNTLWEDLFTINSLFS